MPPSPSSGELWGHHLMPAQVEVSFLMPNGMFVILKMRRDASLQFIKHELWKEAKSYPLYNLLMEPQFYIFVGVTQDGEREEFYDEMRRLCDLRLFQPNLKLIEPVGNKDEKMFNSKLNFIIGMTVSEFDESDDLELITFRRSVLSHCKKVIDERNSRGIEGKALYHYPPNIYPTPHLPHHVMEILKRDQCKVLLTVWLETTSNNRCKFTIKVMYNSDILNVITSTIRRKVRSESIVQDDQEEVIMARAINSLLKVCGYEEYMLGNYPICQYKYIRQCISMGDMPHLMIVDKKKVFSMLSTKSDLIIPPYSQKGVDALQSIMSQPTTSIWNIQKKMKIKINFVSYVNVKDKGEFYVKAGLYQGTEPLCQNQSTRNVESNNPRWYQWIEFDILLKDIPRTAKLCLSLCCSLPKKSKKVKYAMCWCNVNLFDFCNRFVSGTSNLRMWCTPPAFEDLLNPSGCAGSNPSMDNPTIQFEFEQLCKSSVSITFPKQEDVLTEAALLEKNNPPIQKFKLSDIEVIQDIIVRDSLSELSEQDKEFLWKMRQYCKGAPNSLPKLLRAVKWNFKEDVAILYSMLPNWHLINIESSLELLYCYCTDINVRQFAVKCLEDRLSDSQLSQYLLQLVQALEYESYMDNALVQLLLRKALNNEHIGQSFFWYLRALMCYSSKKAYFALILEAYLRTCDNLPSLMQQVEAIEKLTKLSEKLKTEKEDMQIKSLRIQLQSPDYLEVLQNFPSPLDKRFMLGELVIDQCDVKSSKKRPMLLTWKNPDVMAAISVPEFQIIFKIGDDLRQDMLTLQMFALMDNIWQSEGLDLRMIPYGCLATGLNSGMIEVVRNAKTVTQILNKDFRSKELHNWIKDRNRPEVKDDQDKCPYIQAVEAFTKSCAGYCVATFVLGIGDRHPSNIMVTEGGQVFHIDFGHFLDHRKKKFGINRERVPFVLTEDFIQVIAKGQDNLERSKEFKQFMELCGKAYLSLRKHANGFVTLFTMMLSCGIPELQSLDDINYIRKTLKVDCRNHEEAFRYFQQQFNEAYGGAWTTKADWFFHWIKSLT